MALIRAVTLTVLLSFILVASAAGTFIYFLSGYPSPELGSLNVNAVNESFAETNVTIRNPGAEGLVTVQIRSMENNVVVNSVENSFSMTRNETRRITEKIEGGQDISVAVFAPERTQLVQDRSEIIERVPEP